MTTRRMTLGITTLIGAACVSLGTAPTASASPATAAAVKPGLLTAAQVPGFTVTAVKRTTITHGNLASCDAFGPQGGSFSAETLSRGGTGAVPLDLINEIVVHTSGAAAAKTTVDGFRGYLTRCLANQNGGSNGLVPSNAPVKYTIVAHPLAALAGTKAGVEFTVSASVRAVGKTATVITRLQKLPILLYPVGSNVLLVLPDRNAYSVDGSANVTTISEPAALSAVVSKALPLAVKDL